MPLAPIPFARPRTRRGRERRAFTMIEIFTVVTVIGLMIGLLLPAVQASREAARRKSCANNLMQVGLSVHHYHETFRHLPVQLSGTDGSTVAGRDNDRRLSIFVGLLPFLGESSLADRITKPDKAIDASELDGSFSMDYDEFEESAESDEGETQKIWQVLGPEPFDASYTAWATELPILRCPSDPGAGLPALGRTNFAACIGDGMVASNSGPYKSVAGAFQVDEGLAEQTLVAMRGAFVPRVEMRFKDITDGLSHTMLLGEIATDLGDGDARTSAAIGPAESVLRSQPSWAIDEALLDVERPYFWHGSTNHIQAVIPSAGRGYRWADGMPWFTSFNAIVAPNHPTVISGNLDTGTGVMGASSRHVGGVNVCLADGAVIFVSSSIDAGNVNEPTIFVGSTVVGPNSNRGVWGAMSTRASNELVLVDANDG